METLQAKKFKATVLAVGVINMSTGMTSFPKCEYGVKEEGWSIYEGPKRYAYLTNTGFLVLDSSEDLQIGDTLLMVHNDTGRKLKDDVKIIDKSTCNQEELFTMLDRNKFYYRPLRAFSSRPKDARKLSTSYSIKGLIDM